MLARLVAVVDGKPAVISPAGQGGQERGVGGEPPQQVQAEPVDEQQDDVPGFGQAEHGASAGHPERLEHARGQVGQRAGTVGRLHVGEPRTAPAAAIGNSRVRAHGHRPDREARGQAGERADPLGLRVEGARRAADSSASGSTVTSSVPAGALLVPDPADHAVEQQHRVVSGLAAGPAPAPPPRRERRARADGSPPRTRRSTAAAAARAAARAGNAVSPATTQPALPDRLDLAGRRQRLEQRRRPRLRRAQPLREVLPAGPARTTRR